MKYLIKKCLIIYLVMMMSAILMSTVSSLIPPEYIEKNIKDAYELLEHEGVYPSNYENSLGFYDNYTDATSLNIMLMQDAHHPFVAGIVNYWNAPLGDADTPIDRLGYGIERAYGEEEDQQYPLTPYSNYWLSGLLVLKIMMCFFTLGDIRYIFFIAGSMLAILVAKKIRERFDYKVMVAFLTTMVIMCSMYIVSNIQAVVDVLLLEISIFILLSKEKYTRPNSELSRGLLFISIGMINNFISFLYAPIMVINTLIILMYLIDEKNGYTKKRKAAWISIITWTLGYVLSALTKQVLAFLVLGEWTGMRKMKAWSTGDPLRCLYSYLVPLKIFAKTKPILVGCIVFILLFAIVILVSKSKRLFFKEYTAGKILRYVFYSCCVAVIYHVILNRAVGHSFYAQNYFGLVFICLYLAIEWGTFRAKGLLVNSQA